jgi:hypothetical protein
MKIIIKPEIMGRLLCYAVATPNEFSGFGFCTRNKEGDIEMYDFALQDVGTYGYTQTDPKRMLPLFERPDRKNMKIWLHRHPVGNGVPGEHNWSGRDEQTIRFEPLGTTPKDAQWSVSIVITPGGFVGRIDNYNKNITQHLEVVPETRPFFSELMDLERQLSGHKSSRAPERSSSEWEESEHFPSMETSKKRKTRSTTRSSTRTNPKTGKTNDQKKTWNPKRKFSTAITSLKRFVSSVSTLIQSILPSRIYAMSTALTGSGSGAKSTTHDKEHYGGN